MAPEQLAADAPISERTDVYALGVVLYELVTGQPHHTSRSEDPSSRLSVLAPGINPQLERAILKAIARDPQDRPATALEMAAALPDIDTAEAQRRTGGLSMRGHRRKAMWLAGAAVVVGLIAAAAIFAWTRPAKRRPDGSRHDHPGRFPQHHRRSRVRQHVEGRPGRRVGTIAVPESVSR